MDYSITYSPEITMMMFGFGDSHNPHPETVKLVESIVLKQLKTIVQEALKYSDGKVLKGEELVFLMRHNKQKMRRFAKYLMNKQLKKEKQQSEMNIHYVDESEKPKCELLKFIKKIDETGEFMNLSEIDEVKRERQLRADRISQTLDVNKYLQFAKARCMSFNGRNKNLEKLRLWIDPKREINFIKDSLDVLSYYAYQTVAEIVDYALLVRMDSKSDADPFSALPGSYYTATMFNRKHRFDDNNPDYSKVYSSQPPISVNEIKEVMRRVHTPQAGLLNFGGKLPETRYLFAL